MNPTESLMQEHALFEQALDVLAAMADEIVAGHPVPAGSIEALLEFFRSFVDGCHHAKEEGALFPALERAGMARAGGPIGVMLQEHEVGRRLVRQLASTAAELARSQDARQGFGQAASELRQLLSNHIAKENQVLFRMADRLLSPALKAEVAAAFERYELEGLGAGGRERLTASIHELSRIFCAPPAP